MFEKSSLTSAINSIYRSLQNRILNEPKYGINDVEIAYDKAKEILKIHGMSKEDFSMINTVEEFFTGKSNDISWDDNSNKNSKAIRGIISEATLPIAKIIGYRFLYRKLAELYGKKEAKRLTGKMYDYTLAIADSGSLLLPYCFSIDASKLVLLGKPFGPLHSKPTKRLDSYFSVLNEVVHQMSNHLSGAIVSQEDN